MIKRPQDDTPEPAGGAAAERLRMFENARKPQSVPPSDEEQKDKLSSDKELKNQKKSEGVTGPKPSNEEGEPNGRQE